MILMSTVMLYLSIKELRVALTGSEATAQTVPCTSPTPTPTSLPTATPSPSPSSTPISTPLADNSVFLTEFMACPSTGNEWIELYNATNTTIQIASWQVTDESNNKKTINGTLPPLSFSVFEWSGSLLNNTGDSFKITTPTGQLIAQATYDSCSTGVSFVYENGEWVGALESPNEDTNVSENSVVTATTTATLAVTNEDYTSNVTDLAPATLSSPLISPNAIINSASYRSPSISATSQQQSELTSPTKSATQQSKRHPAPAISVILGGLLQLLPGSYAFYENYFKNNTS